MTGRPNPSCETKFSGANGDRVKNHFACVQLTTNRLGDLTRLILAIAIHDHAWYAEKPAPNIYIVGVWYVRVVIPLVLDAWLVDVPASRGHTGFFPLPSAVLALIFLARRIQPSLSLVVRDVEFCVLTN